MAGNFDELKRLIEEDELKDQVDAVISGELEGELTKMTPRDFAKTRRGLQPQLVYYYIRTNKIRQEKCICGRWVIDIKEATEFFDGLDAKKVEKRSGVQR
jgi:hypothetical protein